MNRIELTLEQKIGQMIMAGFPSTKYDAHIEELIREYYIGNIDLFSRNIGSVKETADLLCKIQSDMVKYNKIPAFIGTDQEGGSVSRIRDRAVLFPCNMAFAAAGIPHSTWRQGAITGEMLRMVGINLNIAPVLDVNNNPENPIISTRSYGDDPEEVARLGCAYIEGLQHSCVVATAKHFPGHGDTNIDTHLEMPCVPYGRERLEKIELYPFRKAIEAGVDAIMTAHIVFPALDGGNRPATISYAVLTELLRGQLGFKGLIITDCIEMKAVLDNYGVEKTSVEAIKAGADMLCISHTLDYQIRSAKAIKKAVLNGEISEARIDESVERILQMKEKYKLTQNLYPDVLKLERFFINKPAVPLASDVSRKSITLIRDVNSLLPVKGGNILSISAEPASAMCVEDGKAPRNSFSDAVTENLGGEGIVIPQNPDNGLMDEICRKCTGRDVIILGLYNCRVNPGQIELFNKIRHENTNIIAVLLKSPYDARYLDNGATCIAAYEYSALSISSVIEVLAGGPAYGRLPVSVKPSM